MAEEDLILGGEDETEPQVQLQYEIEYISPVEAINSSVGVLCMLDDRYTEEDPYPDFKDDRLRMIIRAMSIIRSSQMLLQEQLKTE